MVNVRLSIEEALKKNQELATELAQKEALLMVELDSAERYFLNDACEVLRRAIQEGERRIKTWSKDMPL